MSVTKTFRIPALAAAMLMVSALAIPAAVRADAAGEHAGMGHGPMMGPMMMAQGGPGQGMQGGSSPAGGPGQMMQGERGPRAAAAPSRREERMHRMAERRIELLDTDGDGKISAAEIVAEEKRLFTAADVNGDGKLSADEFRRRGRWFVRLGTTSFFDMLDADGDGQLTAAELTGPSERWFKRYDADNNGTIDADEYVKARGRGGPQGGRR